MVNLDLEEPVQYVIDYLIANWSKTPVAVIGADTRGGFDPGGGLDNPVIRQVEGEPGKPRRGRTNLAQMPGKLEITVYEVDTTEGLRPTVDERFGDSETRVTIDIYSIESKARCHACFNEVKRLIYKLKENPTGNYDKFRVGLKTDLTNRTAGFWRRTLDVFLIAVSDYSGHA